MTSPRMSTEHVFKWGLKELGIVHGMKAMARHRQFDQICKYGGEAGQ